MAILSAGILGATRNKVGNVVTYRLKGQNVARVYVDQVSNPQSDAQMRQRAKLINLVAAYRANLFWMRYGAFENKAQKWSDYNAFVSANTALAPVYMTKEQVAAGAGIVQPFTITRGSLQSIDTYFDAEDEFFVSNFFVGDHEIGNNTSIGELSTWMLTHNNGLRAGDQISLIVCYQRTSSTGVPYILTRAYELIINVADSSLVKNAIPFLKSRDVEGGDFWLYVDKADLDNELCSVAFILSREVSGNIQVSTQSLVLSPEMEAYLLNYQTDTAFRNFVDSYGGGGENFLSAGYSSVASNAEVPLDLQLQSLTVGTSTLLNNAEAPDINTGTQIRFNLSDTPDAVDSVRFYWAEPNSENTGSFARNSGISILGPTANYTIVANDITADVTPVKLTRAEVVIGGHTFGISFQYIGDITG